MANVAAVRVPTVYDDDIRLWYWSFTDADTALPVVVAGFPDVTVNVVSKSASCTVNFTGTLVPIDQNGLATPVYHILEDPGAVALTFTTTAVGIDTVKQACYAVKPTMTAGTATAVVYVMASRSRR